MSNIEFVIIQQLIFVKGWRHDKL